MIRTTGHYETVPYDDRTIRSVYHIREYDVARLLHVRSIRISFIYKDDLEIDQSENS